MHIQNASHSFAKKAFCSQRLDEVRQLQEFDLVLRSARFSSCYRTIRCPLVFMFGADADSVIDRQGWSKKAVMDCKLPVEFGKGFLSYCYKKLGLQGVR